MTHSHAWVRLASSRLIGQAFAQYEPSDLIVADSNCLSNLTAVGHAICLQVQSEELEPGLSQQVLQSIARALILYQIVKNLYYVGRGLLSHFDTKEFHNGLIALFKKLGFFARREGSRTPEV